MLTSYRVEVMVETPAGLGHIHGTKEVFYIDAERVTQAMDRAWEMVNHASKARYPQRGEWFMDAEPGVWVDGAWVSRAELDEVRSA